jgi:hypothetical protein
MSTIPSSEIVATSPSVLATGGAGLQVIGLFLTRNIRVPIGAVLPFSGATSVQNFFGPGSEATSAGIYFLGFEGATQTPGSQLWAQYNQGPVAGYLRGGNISAITLQALQALTGTLSVVVGGYTYSATGITLAAASSFSSASAILQTDLNTSLPAGGAATGTIAPETASVTASIAGTIMAVTAEASGTLVPGSILSGTGVTAGTSLVEQLTGTTGGTGTYVVTPSQVVTSTTVTGAYGLFTAVSGLTGAFAVGQTLSGTSVTAGTQITAFDGGTGGLGTYYVTPSQTTSSTVITGTGSALVISYDSTSGAFVITSGFSGAGATMAFATGSIAASLLLTAATGAVLSQGSAPATPAAFMNALIQVNNNWVGFTTTFDPDGGSGNVQKQAFSAWKNTQNNRFAYVCDDTDITPTASVPATSSLGYILSNNGDSGTSLNYEPSVQYLSSFVLGTMASINFQQTGGRITFAFKAQAGFVAGVSDPTTAQNLGGNPQVPGSYGNGYNFYGAYGTAGQDNIWYQRGSVTGPFQWFDSYINQIWLLNQMQVALLTAFGNLLSLPFGPTGQGIIEQILSTPIAAGLSFGAYGPGSLTSAQSAQINQKAGASIANTLAAQGWYLQFGNPSAIVQASRGPVQLTFFYLDRGSIQSINLNSVAVIGG